MAFSHGGLYSASVFFSTVVCLVAASPTFNRTAPFPTLTAATDWATVVDDMLSSSRQPQIFPTPQRKHYFAKVGYVEPTRDWLHLHTTFNLSSLYDYATTPCRCVATVQKFWERDGIHDPVHARLSILLYHYNRTFHRKCDAATTRVSVLQSFLSNATLYSNAPGHQEGPASRTARGVPALLWTAASAAVGASRSSLSHFVLSSLHKGSFIFTLASAALSLLTLGSYLIDGRQGDEFSRLHHWDSYDMEVKLQRCHRDIAALFDYFDTFDEALLQLMHHVYPGKFVHPSVIVHELPSLSRALAEHNIRLLLSNPADIAALPSSFVVADDVLHFFIHVPISPAPRLTAYRYIPTPSVYTVANDTRLATIMHDNSILALTDDHDTFIELPSLNECLEIQGMRFLCPNMPVLQHAPSSSCLMSLFTSDVSLTYVNCALLDFRRSYFATELAPTRFYLYTERPETANILCAAPIKLALNQPFASSRAPAIAAEKVISLQYSSSIVELPTHCHLRIFNLSLYPASTHKTDVLLAKSATTGDIQNFFTVMELDDIRADDLDSPTPSYGFHLFRRYRTHFLIAVILCVLIILCLGIVLIPLCCVKRRAGKFYVKHPLRQILLCLHSSPDARRPVSRKYYPSSPGDALAVSYRHPDHAFEDGVVALGSRRTGSLIGVADRRPPAIPPGRELALPSPSVRALPCGSALCGRGGGEEGI